MNKRVVVTGLGVISSIGIGKDEFWKNLIAGKSGISEITAFDTSKYPVHRGGECHNFNPEEFICRKKIPSLGRASQLAIAASKLALKDANLKDFNREKTGIAIGTTMGEIQILEKINDVWVENGEAAVDFKLIPRYPSNVLSSNVAIELKLSGPNYIIPTACAAGNYSIGFAYDLLETAKADIILAGGSDAFSRIVFTGFNRLYAMAPEKCQPFDKNRKGMMVGEGSAIVVLENLESAKKRNVDIYAEVLGYGLSCGAGHMTIPSPSAITKVMQKALFDADLKPTDIDYINTHGTGTSSNDKVECDAIKEVFKEHSKELLVNSIKSMLGHTMGAASALEAVSCCLTVKNNIIPPTINYETSDPECDIDCVPNAAREHRVNCALNNSYAFGGNNACLVIRKFC